MNRPVVDLLGGRRRDRVPFSAYLFYKYEGAGGDWLSIPTQTHRAGLRPGRKARWVRRRLWPRQKRCASSLVFSPSSSKGACLSRSRRWPRWLRCARLSAPMFPSVLTQTPSGPLKPPLSMGSNQYRYCQLFTPPDRLSIAVEPMSCCADAVNNYEGLIRLMPGDTFDAS